eukprot:1394623-Amorphochlora_amoeboformis.AAC.1
MNNDSVFSLSPSRSVTSANFSFKYLLFEGQKAQHGPHYVSPLARVGRDVSVDSGGGKFM